MERLVNNDMVKQVVSELENSELSVVLSENNYDQLKKVLSEKVNLLITKDFSRLISILYRLDISEKKLSYLLAERKGTNAGDIIANMIIERELQKIQSRQTFKFNDTNIPDEDRW